MRLSLARAIATHVAVASAFLAIASAGDFPIWAMAGFLGTVAISLLRGGRKPPSWLAPLLTVITAGSLLVVLLLVSRGLFDLVFGASAFASVVMLNRMLSRQRPEEDPLLFFLSLAMLAGGAALSGEMLYGVCFAIFGLSATIGITLSHLEREALASGLNAEVGKPLDMGLLRALLGLSLLSLLASTAFFFLMPRMNARWFGQRLASSRQATVGFSGRVQLGGVGLLRGDPTPTLRIELPEQSSTSRPEVLDQLWRGVGLDTFDGRVWSVSKRRTAGFARIPDTKFNGVHARVEVLPSTGGDALFSPGLPVAAARLGSFMPGEGPQVWSWFGSGDLFVEPRFTGPFAYEVWARVPQPSTLVRRGHDYPDEIVEHDLQLPGSLDPRIRELAQSWTKGQTDPYEQARAIVDHLSSEFRYTLELPGDVPDPLANFLFGRKAGHCEFFSTAMVVMLRTLGVPAREVTGFSGGVLSPSGDHYLVRAGDAHSWAEVYFPGVGFAPFDPTPPDYHRHAPAGTTAYLRALLDSLEKKWQSAILDYNLATQVHMAQSLLRALRGVGDRFRRDDEAPQLPGSTVSFRRLIAPVVGLALLFVAWRSWLRRSRRRVDDDDEAVVVYRTLMARLDRRGLTRSDSETPRAFANRLREAHRPEAETVEELTALYERSRYASHPWSPAERSRASLLLKRLENEAP
jgi:transglutaminase-like putative cysteine protease